MLRTRGEIRALALTLFAVTGVAGVGFLLFPAEPAYAPHALEGFWSDIFAFNHQIVRRYNMVPSLHVALSTVALAAYGTGRGVWCRGLLAALGGSDRTFHFADAPASCARRRHGFLAGLGGVPPGVPAPVSTHERCESIGPARPAIQRQRLDIAAFLPLFERRRS